MSLSPALFVLTVVVTVVAIVAVYAAVARRVIGAPVGLVRTVLAGVVAVSVSFGTPAAAPLATPGGFPAYLPVQVGVALVAALTFLVVAEVLVPAGSWPGPTRWPGLLRRRVGRSRRYGQILSIAVRHGLGSRLRGGARRESSPRGSRTRRAGSLRRALQEGGVTFVKLGQLAATRPDLLPAEFVAELSRLQHRVPPASWEQVEQVLTEDLGAPPGQVFAEFDPQPMAGASIAQVHRARLPSGAQVVVKVQRPGIRPVVERDLDIVARIARLVQARTRWGRTIGAVELAAGFATALREELDFRVEARNMIAVAAASARHGPDDAVRVPTLHEDLCTDRVLVMERLDGVPLAAAEADIPKKGEQGEQGKQGEQSLDRLALARSLHGCVLRQVMSHGVFHADPHPGNVLLLTDGRLGLLDFGSVGRLDLLVRTALGQLLFAIDHTDPAAARDSFLELVARPEDLDEQRLEWALGHYMARHLGAGSAADVEMFTDLFRLVTAYELEIRPEVAAVFRALATLEGTLALLAPGFDIVKESRAFASAEIQAQVRERSVSQTLTDELYATLPLLRRLPRRVDRITGALEQGRLGVNVRLFADERDRRFATNLLHQIVLTFLAATAGIMAVLLLGASGGPAVTPTVSLFQVFGYNLLAISSILALRVLFTIFRRQR